MHIAVDLRSLSSGKLSGVENYIVNLIDHLLALDRKNEYTLFYNSWTGGNPVDFHFINSKVKTSHIPNKLLNAAFKTRAINIESLVGRIDCLFLPNLSPFSVSARTKLAITVHDLSPVVAPEFYDLRRRLWHRFLGYRSSFVRADAIFAVSHHTKDDLVRLFHLEPSRITVAYPGIDRTIFHPSISVEVLRDVRNRYGLPGEFILFLNTIEPRKNLTGLLAAFEQLPGDMHLVVAGRKGWKYGELFKALQRSSKRRLIHYIGYIDSEEDKAAILKLARAVAYPSFYEGFGFQPIEAMAVGTPVVASNVTSVPEVVGEAGLLVSPYQPAEIAYALRQLVSDGRVRDVFIDRGLRRVERFDWDRTANVILQGLNTLHT